MANRLVSNMYIIDSSSTTCPLPYGLATSGAWNSATTANTGKMRVMSVIVNMMDTSSRCTIALMDTNNIVLDYAYVRMGSGNDTGTQQRVQVDHFGYGVPWMGVFVPTLTACTMCLVLE